jgi:hypothetical protein
MPDPTVRVEIIEEPAAAIDPAFLQTSLARNGRGTPVRGSLSGREEAKHVAASEPSRPPVQYQIKRIKL